MIQACKHFETEKKKNAKFKTKQNTHKRLLKVFEMWMYEDYFVRDSKYKNIKYNFMQKD